MIRTIEDFLCFYPRDYEDRRSISSIMDLREGEPSLVRAVLRQVRKGPYVPRKKRLLRLLVEDQSGVMEVLFFNALWLEKSQGAILEELKAGFPAFLSEQVPQNPLKAEYLLPRSVDQLLKQGRATVQVLKSEDRWYGVTYAADKPMVVAALAALRDAGKYPDGLWK